jgi:hypothetical protein
MSFRTKFKVSIPTEEGGPFFDNVDTVCFAEPVIVREYPVYVVSFIAD